LGAGAALAAIFLIVGVAIFLSVRPATPPMPAVPGGPLVNPQDAEARRRELMDAFANRKPLLADADLVHELQPLFKDLGEAYQARDGARLASHFDADRMTDELLSGGAIPQPIARDRQGLARGIRTGLQRTLVLQAPFLAWDRFEIKNVKKLANNEVVVIVRHRQQDGDSLKMRWWLTRRFGPWKIYDLEDLDTAMRFSTLAALGAEMGIGNLADLQRAATAIRETSLALLKGDADAAERKLKAIAAMQLPAKLEALVVLQQAMIQIHRGQFQASLPTLDQALRLHPDMPCVDLLKGIAFNGLNQWAKALPCLQAYQKLLGDEAVVCYQQGEALRGLQRFQEAASAYRKALDDNAKAEDAFLGLLRVLGEGDKRDDIPVRFAKLDNPREAFVRCAADCAEDEDRVGLEQLALAMRKIDANFAPVDYYLCLARIWSGQAADRAVPLFKASLDKEKDPPKRDEYTLGFLRAMAKAGKVPQAYAAAPDGRKAFRLLAARLKELSRTWALKELVAAHARKHPDDELLLFYQGEVHVWEGNYALAEKAFATGLARRVVDRLTVEEFRASRVLARYHTADPLTAYKEIGPKEDTFAQIASLLFRDRRDEGLQALLDAHADTHPASVELAWYRCRLHIRQGRIGEGVALFKTVLGRRTQEAERKKTVTTFLRDMVDAGKPIEGYEAAPDARAAFDILAGTLLHEERLVDLERLLQVYRARQADDPLLFSTTGELHLARKAWGKAAVAFAKGWDKADANLRTRFRPRYVYALYKANRLPHAYARVGPQKDTYEQLANLLIADKKGAELERLVSAQRQQRKGEDSALLLFHESRAKLLMRQTSRAVGLFHKAYPQQTNESLRRNWSYWFVQDMAAAQQPLEGYRAVADKKVAFTSLARLLLAQKRTRELLQLLDEHGKHSPGDPFGLFYTGEMYLLRGDLAQAGQYFAAALPKAPQVNQWMFRNGLFRARVKQGRVIRAYEEAGRGRPAFEQLAQVCLSERKAKELAALIGTHRQADPADPDLAGWEVEVKWLNKEHEEVLRMLTEQRDSLLSNSRFRWRFPGYLVRCLVRLNKTEQAVAEAETLGKSNRGDPLLLVLALAARGDARQAIAAMDKQRPNDYLRQRCYQDEDLGPLLQTEPLRAFRERFPEVKKNRAED
jgi:tetratricopeptide (TPR) repeat protein